MRMLLGRRGADTDDADADDGHITAAVTGWVLAEGIEAARPHALPILSVVYTGWCLLSVASYRFLYSSKGQ